MFEFSDMLYGKVSLPDWLVPFLRVPEFVRLRGVRLSNVDSFQFKDFNGPTRWDHCISVAALAIRCAQKRRTSERELVHLSLAALLHDVATPPFAHTLEHVLENFDHEIESQRILRATQSGDADPAFPVFASQLPQFHKMCERASRQLGMTIDPDEVGRLVVGDGELGFLLNGTLDLDNADNVTRAGLHLGIEVDRQVPLTIADWLANQQGVPVNLSQVREEAVVKWLRYRKALYGAFFNSSDTELGRQAFLQHLVRRALRSGIPRSRLVWNTDEGLLTLLEFFDRLNSESSGDSSLKELVQRYRLFEPTVLIADVPIEDEETLRVIDTAVATNWIERELSGPSFSPFVFVNARRYPYDQERQTLFPPAPGMLKVFKLGQTTKIQQLPTWLRQKSPPGLGSNALHRHLSEQLQAKLPIWVRDRPWLHLTAKRKEDVCSNLDAVGDWSFRLSRNDTLHTYPSTFVHAIPACLISALGLRGELVVDPFGGTGQTAVEAVKSGGQAITADVNSVAVLVAKAKLTYLSSSQQKQIQSMSLETVSACSPGRIPRFDLIEKWHHPDTLTELCRLRSFVNAQVDPVIAQFLRAAFSAILTTATARKGKQHGFFADNTPLSRGESMPKYESVMPLFIDKLAKNLEVLRRLYSSIERAGRDPERELDRAKVLHVDVTKATPTDYGLEEGSVAGIITSPPYLCMSDYSLGQRLSYYWLFPDRMEHEHCQEIGARRKRFQAATALTSYLAGYERFAEVASKLLREGGFLATVLGAPVAESFAKVEILPKTDALIESKGFKLLWSKWRPINWHRNHGYERLKKERIAVYARCR
jgi:HD superfamily phosphohydrolase